MKKGSLIVISGFSGAGKGTIVKRLLEKHDSYALSVSMTTRNPRPGEEEGKSYFFRSEEEFEKTIAEDGFLEYARYCDHYYGTPLAYVENCLQNGQDVILEIEIQGALKVKAKLPETVLIFVTAPSAAVLKDRLTGRGTETDDVIKKRLARAVEESKGVENYDYIVINDDLEQCVDTVHTIVEASHCRSSRYLKLIEEVGQTLSDNS